MNECFADLHIHIGSAKSGKPVKITASKSLTLSSILKAASEEKGMDMIGIIDAHVPEVLEELEQWLQSGRGRELDGGGIKVHQTTLILGSELEVFDRNCSGPIHVLIYMPHYEAMVRFSKWIAQFMKNNTLSSQRVYVPGKVLQKKTKELGGLFIPAHIFTPFKSLYGRGVLRSLTEVFDPELIDAVELGLSADTEMASSIKELDPYPFLANSDAHSAGKISREYQKFWLEEPAFDELVLALNNLKGRKILTTYGLNPLLGKYHQTVCEKCGAVIAGKSLQCSECGSHRVIKGVSERLRELADTENGVRGRPPYIHQVPLQFIPGIGPITLQKLKERFGTEMDILHRVSRSDLETAVSGKVAGMIADARSGKLPVSSGGGGIYGKVQKDRT
ncbi:endonuclease Q family protein [Metabacillus sp. 84]|uniref:endonuclease Q family protein n=1 Tax=Metabacillus sp. 84 TaxID=3404705 RepID=UPI003CF099BD